MRMRLNLQFDRSPLAWIVRLILLSGLVAIGGAFTRTMMTEAPDWFFKPIYDSCILTALFVGMVGSLAEMLLSTTRWIGWRVWLVFVSLAAVISPWLHVFPAAIYGLELAEVSTWHLLPLFAVLKFISPMIIIGGISGMIAFVVWMATMPRGRSG